MAGQTENSNRSAHVFMAIIALALIARVITALISDNFNHPDENFQILEQAHRIVFGYGFIPWEFRYSARSWLVPGFMTALLYPFKWFRLDNPSFYIPAIKVILSLISIGAVWAAYRIGERWYSVKAGLWAAFFCALWYEIIYFSIRPLSDVWAANIFMVSLALALSENHNRNIILSGIMAVLAAAIRINYIPVVLAMIVFFSIEYSSGKRRLYLFSIAVGIVLVAIFDILTLGCPFISYHNIYIIDKSFFMAGAFGSTLSFDCLFFLGYASFYFHWLIPVAGLLIVKKNWRILILIGLILISHLLIPAKKHEFDYRYIYLIIPLIMILGGMILAELNQKFGLKGKSRMLQIGIFLVISILGAMALLPGQYKVYSQRIFKVYNRTIFYSDPRLEAYKFLNHEKNMAGVYDASDLWFRSGGYYYLHRDVPLYYGINPPDSPDYVSHIVTGNNVPALSGFTLLHSIDNINIFARSDTTFECRVDSGFTRNIYQPGIDDRYDPDDF
nr:hypothetical protein [candidate division Zixibacteria bacterium]